MIGMMMLFGYFMIFWASLTAWLKCMDLWDAWQRRKADAKAEAEAIKAGKPVKLDPIW